MKISRSDADRLAVLRGIPELAGWSDRSLQALLQQFDEVAVPAGRVIAVEALGILGDLVSGVVGVVDGWCSNWRD